MIFGPDYDIYKKLTGPLKLSNIESESTQGKQRENIEASPILSNSTRGINDWIGCGVKELKKASKLLHLGPIYMN